MNVLKHWAVLLSILALMSACNDVNSNIEKMIPTDATGVVCIDVPQILKSGGLLDGGKIVLPRELQDAIDNNDHAAMSIVLTDLPQLGLNTDSKAYAFFTVKTFGTVLLVGLDKPELTKKTIAQRTGGDWTNVEGLDCIYKKDNLYAIKGNVLLAGTVNKNLEVAKVAKAAQNILSHNHTSIMDNKAVKEVLHSDGAVNVWLQNAGLKALLSKSDTYREIVRQVPLIDIFTESDIDAITCNVALNDAQVDMATVISAADNSEYAQLLTGILSKPSGETLKAIPNSMDCILTMSVKGDNFVKLQQMQQLLGMFGKLPYIGRIDLAGILATVDGPFTIGIARDPHLEGEWNAVVAIQSSDPERVLNQISSFANSMGQAPELYDGEYVYQYDNKMIRIGMTDGILYLKMLDYEQTEGYAYELPAARNCFNNALLGVFVQSATTDTTHAYFDFALTDIYNGKGHFTTEGQNGNATLELLKVLCSIKPKSPFDEYDDDEDVDDQSISTLVTGAIDKLKPLN